MPTEVLSPGPPQTMTANVVYALPAIRCRLFTTGAPTITKGNDLAMTAPVAVALTDGEAEVSSGFLKSTTTILVTLKRA